MRDIYLIDSNSLITPYERYYPFDFANSFWLQLKTNIESGNVIILDMVKNEITQKNDQLSDWMKSIDSSQILEHRDLEIIRVYQEVLENVKNNPVYKEAALMDWSNINSADPWLIATANVKGYKIVTFETHNNNLNISNPSKRAKIPDVADEFNVETVSLFSMMRKLDFRM